VVTTGVQTFLGPARQRLVGIVTDVQAAMARIQGSCRGAQYGGLAAQSANAFCAQGARVAGQAGSRRFEQFEFFQGQIGEVLQLG